MHSVGMFIRHYGFPMLSAFIGYVLGSHMGWSACEKHMVNLYSQMIADAKKATADLAAAKDKIMATADAMLKRGLDDVSTELRKVF